MTQKFSVIVLGFADERVSSLDLVPFGLLFADNDSARGMKIRDVRGEFQLPELMGGAIDRSVPSILELARTSKAPTVAERVILAVEALTSGISAFHVVMSSLPGEDEFENLKMTLPPEVFRVFKQAVKEAGHPLPTLDYWELHRRGKEFELQTVPSPSLISA